jgi:hypothetical protein
VLLEAATNEPYRHRTFRTRDIGGLVFLGPVTKAGTNEAFSFLTAEALTLDAPAAEERSKAFVQISPLDPAPDRSR